MFKVSIFKTCAYLFLLIPLAILIYIRKDVYFTNKSETIKMSFGLVFAAIVGMLLLLGKTKNINSIIWCGILALITYLLQSIMIDIMWVFICSGVGLMFYKIFNSIAIHYLEIVKVKRNAKIEYVARKELDKEYGNV